MTRAKHADVFFNTDEQKLEELGRELVHLKETVRVLDARVLEFQQSLQQQQQQQQKATINLIDSVDQLKELTNVTSWEARVSADRSQREKLQPVRMLRARIAGALPCVPTTAGVATFLGCEESSLEEVVPMHDNARGKQRFLLRFKSAEAAAAAYTGFRGSSNAAQAVLTLKHTLLQNTLISLAMYLQQTARGSCGFGEELVVLAKGPTIKVRLGVGDPVTYPFHIHLPAGRLPSPGEPFQRASTEEVARQLGKLLGKPSPLRAPSAPCPTAAAGTAATAAAEAAEALARTPASPPPIPGKPEVATVAIAATRGKTGLTPTRSRPAVAAAATTPCKRKATTTPSSIDMVEEAAAPTATLTAGEQVPERLDGSQASWLEHPGGRGRSLWPSDSGVIQSWSRRKGYRGRGRGGRRGGGFGQVLF